MFLWYLIFIHYLWIIYIKDRKNNVKVIGNMWFIFSSTPGKGNDENGPTKNSNNSDLHNYDGDPP